MNGENNNLNNVQGTNPNIGQPNNQNQGVNTPQYQTQTVQPSVQQPMYQAQNVQPSVQQPMYQAQNVQPSVQQPMNQAQNVQPSIQQPMNQAQNIQPTVQQPINQAQNVQPTVQQPINQAQNVQPTVQQPINQAQNVQPTVQQPTYQPNPNIQPQKVYQNTNPVQMPQQTVQSVPMAQQTVSTTIPSQGVVNQPQPMAQPVHDIQETQTIQPTQTVENEQPIQNMQVEFVNPMDPNQVLKAENLTTPTVKTQVPITNDPIPTNSDEQPKKKKKKLNLTVIAIFLVVVILGAVVYFTFFSGNTKKPTPPNSQVVTAKLNIIVNNLKENENFKKLDFENIVTEVKDNTLTLTLTNNNKKYTYTYKLENNILKTEVAKDDLSGFILSTFVFDAAAQTTGLNANDLVSIIGAINPEQKIDGLEITKNANNVTMNIDLNKKIDTSILNNIYFEEKDYNKFLEQLIGDETVTQTKGKLYLYKYNNEKFSIITFAEKDNLTDLTYKSIINLITLLYPNELDNFETEYPSLSDKTFGRYTITLNQTLDDVTNLVLGDLSNEYKFIQIKIDKSL